MLEWGYEAAAYILDLDGTLWRGGRPMPGAAELLRRLEGRYVVASNNSTDDAESLSQRLAAIGLAVPPGRLVLAGETAVALTAAWHPAARVLLLGSPVLRRLALRAGLRLEGDEQTPQVVLLARDTGFTYDRLCAAADALLRGARLVVANPDLTHPAPGGLVVPETGSLLQAVLACTGDVPRRVVGKPEPPLFEEALRRLGSVAGETVVIGDNPATDGAGADRLGCPFVLIGDHPAAIAADPLGLLQDRPRRRAAG